jgi:glycine cleavage system H protein
MSDLVFLMGAYEARVPTDRSYCANHMWAQPQGDTHRFGLTAYAVRLLHDVYFLEWCVEEDVHVAERQMIGTIESKKAESDLYAPAAGRLVRFNAALMDDPSAINADHYGSGWLFELQVAGGGLMAPEQYLAHLGSVWETTQRTLKGQMS